MHRYMGADGPDPLPRFVRGGVSWWGGTGALWLWHELPSYLQIHSRLGLLASYYAYSILFFIIYSHFYVQRALACLTKYVFLSIKSPQISLAFREDTIQFPLVHTKLHVLPKLKSNIFWKRTVRSCLRLNENPQIILRGWSPPPRPSPRDIIQYQNTFINCVCRIYTKPPQSSTYLHCYIVN